MRGWGTTDSLQHPRGAWADSLQGGRNPTLKLQGTGFCQQPAGAWKEDPRPRNKCLGHLLTAVSWALACRIQVKLSQTLTQENCGIIIILSHWICSGVILNNSKWMTSFLSSFSAISKLTFQIWALRSFLQGASWPFYLFFCLAPLYFPLIHSNHRWNSNCLFSTCVSPMWWIIVNAEAQRDENIIV